MLSRGAGPVPAGRCSEFSPRLERVRGSGSGAGCRRVAVPTGAGNALVLQLAQDVGQGDGPEVRHVHRLEGADLVDRTGTMFVCWSWGQRRAHRRPRPRSSRATGQRGRPCRARKTRAKAPGQERPPAGNPGRRPRPQGRRRRRRPVGWPQPGLPGAARRTRPSRPAPPASPRQVRLRRERAGHAASATLRGDRSSAASAARSAGHDVPAGGIDSVCRDWKSAWIGWLAILQRWRYSS